MPNDIRERIERAARWCELNLQREASALARGDFDAAADASEAAEFWAGAAFELAVSA